MAEAVHACTALGAYTQCADIAVLSRDIFSIPAELLESGVRCDLTMRAGQVVFDRLGQFATATW